MVGKGTKGRRQSQPSMRRSRAVAKPAEPRAVIRADTRGLTMAEPSLKALLDFGERRDVEIKGPGSVDDPPFLAYVARAALALSNHRAGGRIGIGAVPVAGSASY